MNGRGATGLGRVTAGLSLVVVAIGGCAPPDSELSCTPFDGVHSVVCTKTEPTGLVPWVQGHQFIAVVGAAALVFALDVLVSKAREARKAQDERAARAGQVTREGDRPPLLPPMDEIVHSPFGQFVLAMLIGAAIVYFFASGIR